MQPKLKLLKILDILRETDETHPITAPAICKMLSDAGINAERKSVCRDINTLIEYGYKITLCRDNKLGYYMEGGEEAPAPRHTPVSLDLVYITLEYKKEDAETVYDIIGKGSETEDGDYIVAEIGVPSSNLFANLFQIGTLAKLTAPAELKDEFEKRLSDVSDFYRKRRAGGKMDVWLL